ncbi:uncharacterized protein TNCV_3480561 [Trichonephila clavipes]|nr:uncharacterized protein TNCV_3480561 [Trichonephila clavipes]
MMLDKNVFKKTKKPIYQQLNEFEQGRVIRLQGGGFTFRDISEKLGRNVFSMYGCWRHWTRDASRRLDSMQPRGTTEREKCRIRRAAMVHCTAELQFVLQ